MGQRIRTQPGAERNKPPLSPRQFECLQGVADHLDSVQIADRLGISEHTVNGHLAAAVSALGAASRRDAVRRYLALQAEHPEKLTGQFLRVPVPVPFAPAEAQPAAVREAAPSEWRSEPLIPPADAGARRDVGRQRFTTLAIVIGIAAAIVILILAAEPLSQSAMRIANQIAPFNTK